MDSFFTSFGDKVINFSKDHLLSIIMIISLSYLFKRLSFQLIRLFVTKRWKFKLVRKDDEAKRQDTIISVFHSIISVMTFITAFVLILKEIDLSLAPFLASAGIAGAIIGFGVQSFIKDLISGTFVLVENQYRVGDWVTLAGISGKVEDVGLRITTLTDADNKTYYIPHSAVDVVTNHSKNPVILHIKLNLSYKSDLDKAKKIINKAGDKLIKDPELANFILEKPQFKMVNNFGPSGIEISIKGKVKNGHSLDTGSKLRELVNDGLVKGGIEIATQMVLTTSSEAKPAKLKSSKK
jgi:small-conductance mechanosensitive channel